ncbi:MAG: RNA 2',3'-cyclic phosphodiesterase, partial [Dechloromonas sp.]
LDGLAVAAARQFGGRPTQRATLHLKLAFLGDVGSSQLPDVLAAGERVAAAPFTLHVDRLGFWPHNHLLWAGCAPVTGLDLLVARLDAALSATGHPLPARGRNFRPHLTLVRKIYGTPPQAEIDRLLADDLPEWRCARFRLVESRLSASGPGYSTLAEFALAA